MAEHIGPSPDQLTEKKNEYYIFFPGATGGGKALTPIREKMEETYGRENVYIPSSITTPESLKQNESPKERIEKIAEQIILRSPNGQNIIAHSFGSYETLDLVRALLNKGFTGNMRVEFIGTPGLFKRGLPALIEFAKRVTEMGREVTINEQHVLYPLPDKFYNSEAVKGSTKLWEDSNDKRQIRRLWFIENLSRLVPDNEQKTQLVKELTEIDTGLNSAADDSETQDFMSRRIKLLAPLLQDIFKGKHLNPEQANAFLEYYGETPQELTSKLAFIAQSLGYCGKIFARIYDGLGKEINTLRKQAKTTNNNLIFGFATMENDAIIKDRDLQDLKTEDLINLGAVEQLAHSSIAYYPDPLKSMFERLERLS